MYQNVIEYKYNNMKIQELIDEKIQQEWWENRRDEELEKQIEDDELKKSNSINSSESISIDASSSSSTSLSHTRTTFSSCYVPYKSNLESIRCLFSADNMVKYIFTRDMRNMYSIEELMAIKDYL